MSPFTEMRLKLFKFIDYYSRAEENGKVVDEKTLSEEDEKWLLDLIMTEKEIEYEKGDPESFTHSGSPTELSRSIAIQVLISKTGFKYEENLKHIPRTGYPFDSIIKASFEKFNDKNQNLLH
jgi:hypothetical protein